MSSVAAIRRNFEIHADRPCLIGADGAALTYAVVAREAGLRAACLAQEGAGPGDVVCFFGDNSLEAALWILGAWTAGCTLAPVNKDLGPAEMAQILANAAPRLILADAGARAAVERACPDVADRIRPVAAPGRTEGGLAMFERLNGAGAFLVIYTAGSTGAPKGVQIGAEALIGNERLFCQAMDVDETRRFYNILPMSYLGGLHNLLLLPLSVGASVVIDQPLGPSNLFYFWRRVQDLQIDTLWLTGAMLSMLLEIPPRGDESWIGAQVRLGLVGMAPLQAETRRRFEARFGFPLHQNYALSETLFLTSQRPGRDLAPLGCGQLLPGMEISFRDAAGAETAPGEGGELHVRTPHMMLGYRNAAASDQAALADGVFRTGDLGRLDENGELHITGRIKDLIIRGGMNIAPATVEAALADCALIQEAAVVGAPDPFYGEEVVAVVAPSSRAGDMDEAELKRQVLAHAADRLPQFQRPKRVFVWDTLPRNHARKIDKPAIRARLAQMQEPSR